MKLADGERLSSTSTHQYFFFLVQDSIDDEHHRYQSSDEEDFQESLEKAVTLPKPILLWYQTPASPALSCSTLIIGTAFGASALLHTIQSKTLLGSLILPGVDLVCVIQRKEEFNCLDPSWKGGCLLSLILLLFIHIGMLLKTFLER